MLLDILQNDISLVMAAKKNICPCFNEESFDTLLEGIKEEKYKFDPNKYCITEPNSLKLTRRNGLYVAYADKKNMIEASYFPMQIGYGVKIQPGCGKTSTCTEYDMIRSIYKSQALKCLDIINQGCAKLKGKDNIKVKSTEKTTKFKEENTCPCFNSNQLKIFCLRSGTSCTQSGTVRGISDKASLDNPRFALDKEKQMCRNGKTENDVNKKEFLHCDHLLSMSCGKGRSSTSDITGKFVIDGERKSWCKWANRKNTMTRCNKHKLVQEQCPITCMNCAI